MPKEYSKLNHLNPNPHKHSNPSDEYDNKNDCTSFLDKELCIEAKVTINPEVSIGNVTIDCLDATIEPCSQSINASEECTLIVSQLIRVKIPIRFSAKADAEKYGVSCKSLHSEEYSEGYE